MAFYSNSLNFPNLTNKSTPVGADILLIADSAAGNIPKQCLVSTLPFAPNAGGTVVNVTSATQQLAGDAIYFVNYTGGVCTLTLPTALNSIQGQFIVIIGGEAATNPFVIAQNALQQIRSVTNLTTAGVSGTITMNDITGNIALRCDALTGGLTWAVVGGMGSFAGV